MPAGSAVLLAGAERARRQADHRRGPELARAGARQRRALRNAEIKPGHSA